MHKFSILSRLCYKLSLPELLKIIGGPPELIRKKCASDPEECIALLRRHPSDTAPNESFRLSRAGFCFPRQHQPPRWKGNQRTARNGLGLGYSDVSS